MEAEEEEEQEEEVLFVKSMRRSPASFPLPSPSSFSSPPLPPPPSPQNSLEDRWCIKFTGHVLIEGGRRRR